MSKTNVILNSFQDLNAPLHTCFKANCLEAGCDEAGRGCLAGPVFAAAVIFPDNYYLPQLNDSKKMTEKKRYELRPAIEDNAIAWAVAYVDNRIIDRINIQNASYLAMHKALDKLCVCPDHLIIDGNRFKKYKNVLYKCIVKGDSKYLSIAAASVLAKTYRDDYMKSIHKEHPQYNWEKNKGYPTKEHKNAIVENDITKYHRKSFKLKEDQLSLDL